MIFSENRYPPRIKSGAGFFGIMLKVSFTYRRLPIKRSMNRKRLMKLR
jgi:hypothetical protein